MRELITFPCQGDTLFGTLDRAEGKHGLLIVSGGNELRIGAHRGMASLAGRLAAAGYPVLRFDRRGIGDSTGANRGFESSGPDIATAVTAFRSAVPGLNRIVAFGSCDAATALALHDVPGIDALVLANPWVIEPDGGKTPPAAAIRARYAARLKDPSEWRRLLSGGVHLGKLMGGLAKIARRSTPAAPESLAARLATALNTKAFPVIVLLATRDNTAIAFAEALNSFPSHRAQIERLNSDSHSFHRAVEREWLFVRLADALT